MTVTVALHVDTFPLPSVTVKVTVLAPTLEQSNVLGDTDTDAIAQLSVEPLSMSAVVMEALPKASKFTVKF